MYAIETKDLTKKYKDMTAVNSLCLKVEEGKLLALLGVNGAGKTTTVKMLSCLTPPTSGDALICGVSIKNDPGKVKELINVSPQETAVAQKLSVRENLETSAGIYGFGKRTAKQKAQTMIKEFSLEDVAQKRAGKLSGGYQRRLSIAMALISEPKVLFLDEPTLGLDVIARRELWGVIEKLKGKIYKTKRERNFEGPFNIRVRHRVSRGLAAFAERNSSECACGNIQHRKSYTGDNSFWILIYSFIFGHTDIKRPLNIVYDKALRISFKSV